VGAVEDEPATETPNLLEMGAVVAALLRLRPDLADIVKVGNRLFLPATRRIAFKADEKFLDLLLRFEHA
jgi:hypothetical protein